MELALGIGIPLAVTAILYTFKTNAALLFFVICASALLFERGTEGIQNILGSTIQGNPQLLDYVVAVLLVLPALIGALVFARQGKNWLAVQLAPSIVCGLVIYVTAARVARLLFDANWQTGAIWGALSAREDMIIALGMFACLMLVPFGGKSSGHHGGKHAKH